MSRQHRAYSDPTASPPVPAVSRFPLLQPVPARADNILYADPAVLDSLHRRSTPRDALSRVHGPRASIVALRGHPGEIDSGQSSRSSSPSIHRGSAHTHLFRQPGARGSEDPARHGGAANASTSGPLTQASLAALTASSNQLSRPTWTPYPYSTGPHTYGLGRQSATPSTTSVSGEDDDGDIECGLAEEEEGDLLEDSFKDLALASSVAPGTVEVGSLKRKGAAKVRGRFARREEAREWLDRKGKRKVPKESVGMAESLPEEVLTHIFSLLKSPRDLLSALLVSRTWCLSAFPLLWARPQLGSSAQFAAMVRILVTPRSELSLPYHSYIRRAYLSSFASSITDDLLLGLIGCQRIERLTLSNAGRLTASALRLVINSLPELVAVDLNNCPAVDDGVLKVVADRCARLQGLNLSGCKSVGDEGIKAISKGCKMLRRVKLVGCHRLQDSSLIALSRACPLLLELDLVGAAQISNAGLYALWLYSPNLREIKLAGNTNISSEGVPMLGDLSSMNVDEMEEAAGNLKAMLSPELLSPRSESADVQGLRFDLATRFSPALGIRLPSPHQDEPAFPAKVGAYPSEVGSSAKGRGRAVTLDLTWMRSDRTVYRPRAEVFEHLRIVDFTLCTALDDLAIERLVANAPKLRSITLNKCGALTDRAVEALSKLGKHLHYVHLGHVEQITDAAVTKLARSCTRLRYVDLASCPLLTDLSVFELSTNLPKLRRIGLVKVVNITDEGINALSERHASLERIHLSYCDNVTVRAITTLLNRLVRLTHLSLTAVSAFRDEGLQQFRRPAPPEFNEHQRASMCVYSGHGISALRNYLNAQQAANTAGSDSSTRRGSGSSASSITLPGADNSPPYIDSGLAPYETESQVEAWVGRGGTARVVSAHDSSHHYDAGSSSRSHTVDDPGPQLGEQIYRRISTASLPHPPTHGPITSAYDQSQYDFSSASANTRPHNLSARASPVDSRSERQDHRPSVRASQAIANTTYASRPSASSRIPNPLASDIGSAFATQTSNFLTQIHDFRVNQSRSGTGRSSSPTSLEYRDMQTRRSSEPLETASGSRIDPRGHERAGRMSSNDERDWLPRIPGEYPGNRTRIEAHGSSLQTQQFQAPARNASRLSGNDLARSGSISPHGTTSRQSSVGLGIGVTTSASRHRESGGGGGSGGDRSRPPTVATTRPVVGAHVVRHRQGPVPSVPAPAALSRVVQTDHLPTDSFITGAEDLRLRDDSRGHDRRRDSPSRTSTGTISVPSAPSASDARLPAMTTQMGRDRSDSGSSLTERLRSASIGEVARPLRWVAEMVGWTAEGESDPSPEGTGISGHG